jgi:hypothetical protein
MDPMLLRLLAVAAVVGVTVLAGRWWRARDGHIVTAHDRLSAAELAAVGLDVGGADRLALLLGSPTCAPCVTVRGVLTDLAASDPSLRWTSVDAAQHLDLVRRLNVMRVPTLLLMNGTGAVGARTSGVPRHDDVRKALHGEVDLVA